MSKRKQISDFKICNACALKYLEGRVHEAGVAQVTQTAETWLSGRFSVTVRGAVGVITSQSATDMVG